MRYQRLLYSFSIFTIIMILVSCGIFPNEKQQIARKELNRKGIQYTTEAFFDAIAKDDIDTLNLFFAAGMNPNAKNKGMPALKWAVLVGNNEALKLLIDKGAKVNAKIGGQSTLMFAADMGYRADKVKILIDYGAKVNQKSKYGSTALILAVSSKDVETVKVLIANGADINIKNNDGKTALMLAKEKGSAEIVKLLQQAGAKE